MLQQPLSIRTDLDDYALLRKFEPVLRFTKGELYYPTDVEGYVAHASLWASAPNHSDQVLIPEGHLTLETLAQPRSFPFGTVEYMRFVQPLSLGDVVGRALKQGDLQFRALSSGFDPGIGRLARVGLLPRLIDAGFSLSMILRGKVSGATAAVAEEQSKYIQSGGQKFVYYGRVVRQQGWIGLNYWFFYHYDDWRSSFDGVNDHEADWENVWVFLYEDEDGSVKPEWVLYAAHDFTGDDLRRRWDDREQLDIVDETHPVVYIGAGSHAAYYRPGEYLIESEAPGTESLTRYLMAARRLWNRAFGQGDEVEESAPFLTIPFVEYVRGDGLSVGPGQDHEWKPVLLDPPPAWLTDYHGLWGLFTRDPVGGENAPAGPMYNRDGTPRYVWYDPLGFAGLDKVPTPLAEKSVLHEEIDSVAARQKEIERELEAKQGEMEKQGAERAALNGFSYLAKDARGVDGTIVALGDEIQGLRLEHARNKTLLSALAVRVQRLNAGIKDDPRAHIGLMQAPMTTESMRFARAGEIWSALSIGLLLVVFVVLLFLGVASWINALISVIVLFAVIEAVFQRRVANVIAVITVILALVTLVLLALTYWREMLVVGVLAAGIYLTWQNSKVAWAALRAGDRKKAAALAASPDSGLSQDGAGQGS
ncbi:MAG: hypothetical protein U0768_13825 [Anaerolineae bacterium]